MQIRLQEGFAVSTRRIEEEVRRTTREVSSNFVVEPSIEEVKSDLLIALKRYRQSVRTRALLVERMQSDNALNNNGNNLNDTTVKPDGLGTNLRPTGGCGLNGNNPASENVEAYLY